MRPLGARIGRRGEPPRPRNLGTTRRQRPTRPHLTPRSRPNPNRPRGAPFAAGISSARRADEGEERKEAALARSARRLPTPTCFPGARRRSCSSWRRGNAAYIQEKLCISEGTAKPTSATSTRRRTSTASRSSCASSSLRIPPNSELALTDCSAASADRSQIPRSCTNLVVDPQARSHDLDTLARLHGAR